MVETQDASSQIGYEEVSITCPRITCPSMAYQLTSRKRAVIIPDIWKADEVPDGQSLCAQREEGFVAEILNQVGCGDLTADVSL